MKKPKYIVVLGTVYSGSGAVFDYLAGRGDLYDPFLGDEYQMPQAPHGLMALESTAGSAFHHATADYALVNFERVARIFDRTPTLFRSGKDYASKQVGFMGAVESFLGEITGVDFPMHLDWHRYMSSPFKRVLSFLERRLGIRGEPLNTRLLVSPEKLIAAAQKMHDEMFLKNSLGRPILLNQAGSGWNPIESTKYFSNCKVIVVTRDPRDQFIDIAKYKKATSVEGFIDWYAFMQKRISKVIKSPEIIHVNFEDFVHNHNAEKETLCSKLGLEIVESTYDANKSKKNIGMYETQMSLADQNKFNHIL